MSDLLPFAGLEIPSAWINFDKTITGNHPLLTTGHNQVYVLPLIPMIVNQIADLTQHDPLRGQNTPGLFEKGGELRTHVVRNDSPSW